MLVVDTQTLMRGTIIAAGTVKLDGWFEGDIVCSRLEIGADGYLLGSATARELWVEGQLVGSVNAGTVHLLKNALVEGDVLHDVLSKHHSATLTGRAIRSRGFQMPPDLLMLEAKALIDQDDMERAMRDVLAGNGKPAAVPSAPAKEKDKAAAPVKDRTLRADRKLALSSTGSAA